MSITLTQFPANATPRDEFATRVGSALGYNGLCDPLTTVVLAMRSLLSAELACCPKFTGVESFQLLQLYQGTFPEPFVTGTLLAQEAEDGVEDFGIERGLITKLYLLTPTQDWAIRLLLHEHEVNRGNGETPSLRQMGFPLI